MGQTPTVCCNAEAISSWEDSGAWRRCSGQTSLPSVARDRVDELRTYVSDQLPTQEVPQCLSGTITRRASSSTSLDEGGLHTVFGEASSKRRRAAAIASVTDPADLCGASFKEKSQEVMYPPECEKEEEALVRWLQDEMGIGWACKKGLKAGVPNQDSFSIMAVEDSFILLGVYDGHGHKGHEVSQLSREILVQSFLDHPRRETEPEAAFRDSFAKCQEQIAQAGPELCADMSGTTCTMAYVDLAKSMLTIAHVGDSRSVLGWRQRADGADGGEPKSMVDELTVDHKPDLEHERKRIESADPPGRIIFDGFVNYRVYSQKGMYPGLNMSRALGDIIAHKEAGLTAVPDTRTIDLKPLLGQSNTDVMLLICSDGVWEYVQSAAALPLAAKALERGPLAAANRLALEGWDRWIADSGGEGADDITAVCVLLDVALSATKSSQSLRQVEEW